MQSKTYNPGDLFAPGTARMAAHLRTFVMRLGISGTQLGVNGILKLRFWVRKHKLWEYARILDSVLAEKDGERKLSTQRSQRGTEDTKKNRRILDFGGAATLPPYFLAAIPGEVLSLDIDQALREEANRVAQRQSWNLRCSGHDLTQAPLPEGEGKFDAVISCSVLEHIPKKQQAVVMKRLAAALRPGGVMAITFDYGAEAPQADAIRDEAEIARLVEATGMKYIQPAGFVDTGERFVLDRRHPGKRFTFGSLFLRKP